MTTSPSIKTNSLRIINTSMKPTSEFASTMAGLGIDGDVIDLNSTGDATLLVADEGNALTSISECDFRPVVVMLSTSTHVLPTELEASLILAGADAVVTSSNPERINAALDAVRSDQTLVSAKAARVIANHARDRSGVLRGEAIDLTRREIDILVCVGKGESVRKTAASLGISAKTVENLQSRLFRKLNVKNRRHAYERAASLGLLPNGAEGSQADAGEPIISV